MVVEMLHTCTICLACEHGDFGPSPLFRTFYTAVYSGTDRKKEEITWVKYYASEKLQELRRPPYTADWTCVIERIKDFPEEAIGLFVFDAERDERCYYPSILHGILERCLASKMMMRNVCLPDGLVDALINPFHDTCELKPYPLHSIVEILVQGTNAFISGDDLASVIDYYPEALCLLNTVDERYTRERKLYQWNGTPLDRITSLSRHLELINPLPMPASFDCVDALRRFLIETSTYYPNIFVWKPDPSMRYIFLDRFTRMSDFLGRAGPFANEFWMLYLELLRCTCNAHFELECNEMNEFRLSRIDPLIFFTASEYRQNHEVFDKIIETVPSSVRGRHPHTGCTALGVACSSKVGSDQSAWIDEDTIIHMIKIYPLALRTLDFRGRLPLHLAVEGDKDVELIEHIVEKEPRALKTPDGLTKLYPFQLAAVGDKSGHPTNNGEEWQLDVIYTLLRKEPLLAKGLAARSPWERIEDRISNVEKDRDEWKAKAQLLASENKKLVAKNKELEAKLAHFEGNMKE